MKWQYKTVIWYRNEGGKKTADEVPSVISDDGVTVIWKKTVPVPGIITIVYQKNNIEGRFFMSNEVVGNDVSFSMCVSAPNMYYRIPGSAAPEIPRDYVNPTPDEIEDVKRHLREAIPFMRDSPFRPLTNYIAGRPFNVKEISF
ncbi:hypothetical protein [Acetobacter aceti]|uniref:Uncharacterized protein n=1 Tax=Acetobacter aceti TaxID=435 RepID=A0A6S6PLU6_ACEAC|nr:hypothetical protein [Acetobacter aceti]BCI68303.1 hypothetical protein AAJCM20276_29270 [Acetobacter aceti]